MWTREIICIEAVGISLVFKHGEVNIVLDIIMIQHVNAYAYLFEQVFSHWQQAINT